MDGSRNLPNLITIGRILVCPVIFVMAISPSVDARFGAFIFFVIAGLSDLWDGYLARKYGWVTDFGKLIDPLADKLLLLSTFIPFYMISHRGEEVWLIPWWGMLPMWVLIVIIGRELLVTLFRQWAKRKNVVIAAGQSGKYKALIQNLFSGGLLLWYPLQDSAEILGWGGISWVLWVRFHSIWIGVTLGLAIILTVYSMIEYLWRYRMLISLKD